MPTPDRACSAIARVHFSPRRRARMSKHRVTPNDTEHRAPSNLETGRLNQGDLRDLWTLGVRPCGQQRSALPLLRVRLQPFRRGRGTGPLGTGPSSLTSAPALRRVGDTDTRSVPHPPAFVTRSLYALDESQASATWKAAPTSAGAGTGSPSTPHFPTSSLGLRRVRGLGLRSLGCGMGPRHLDGLRLGPLDVRLGLTRRHVNGCLRHVLSHLPLSSRRTPFFTTNDVRMARSFFASSRRYSSDEASSSVCTRYAAACRSTSESAMNSSPGA